MTKDFFTLNQNSKKEMRNNVLMFETKHRERAFDCILIDLIYIDVGH